MSDDCVVSMEDIWTCFGDLVVHRRVSLCVRRGEVVGLVGGSGSGKTTLMLEMIGLLRPARGEVRLFGERVGPYNPRAAAQLRDRCGVLFQGGALFSALTVFDNIAVPLRELRLRDDDLLSHLVGAKLAMVGLPAKAAALRPAELSGGMVKRAGLARALALEPELLLLDEPTSGLDPASSQAFVELVRELQGRLGLTMVIVTHDLDTMADLCHKVGFLADGELVAFGPLALVRAHQHPEVARFFRGARARRVFGEAAGATDGG